MTLDDEAALERYAKALADAIEQALPAWVRRCVTRYVSADPEIDRAISAAGRRVRQHTGAQVRALLATDIDEQRTTPLALVRAAVAEPTAILRDHGVAPVERDEFEQRAFPEDVYRLAPARFADLDPSLTELGMQWGAAKAFVFKQRRRREGRA